MKHFLVSPPLCDFAGNLLALCLPGLVPLALEHKTMEPVGERCQRYACRCTAGFPLIEMCIRDRDSYGECQGFVNGFRLALNLCREASR